MKSLGLFLAVGMHRPSLGKVIAVVDLQRHLMHVHIVAAGQIRGAGERERKFT
jgi:hypothetical protein